MTELFGISNDEAVGRINARWKGLSFTGDKDLIYHEDPDFWARDIYWGASSEWWQKEEKDLKPLPFPNGETQ